MHSIGYVRTTNDQISFSLLPTKYYVKSDEKSQRVKKTPKIRWKVSADSQHYELFSCSVMPSHLGLLGYLDRILPRDPGMRMMSSMLAM